MPFSRISSRGCPDRESLSERFDKFRSRFTIPKDRLDATFKAAIEGCRSRTLAHVSLPAEESFVVEYVTNKSWSGYNWYKGNYHSVIQVNTDLPIFVDRAIDLACHEGYPGHHVYNVLLEKTLVRDRGWVEFSVYPLRSPQSLIAEGSANYGIDIAFPRAETAPVRALSDLSDGWSQRSAVDDYYAVLSLVDRLSYAGNEAARRYLNGQIDAAAAAKWLERYGLYSPPRAQQRMRFVDQYRSYVINYNLGKDMVARYVESQSNGGCRRRASLGCLHATLVVSAASIRVDPMICIEISRPGGPDVLVPVERPDPVPGPDEVLIRVAAIRCEPAGRPSTEGWLSTSQRGE